MDQDLRAKATDPRTDPAELQRLAGEYPALRPLIAMNPSTYPALLDWLAGLGDPAVNIALQQRRAAEDARAAAASGAVTQRVSVISRSGSTHPTPAAPGIAPSAPSAAHAVADQDEQQTSRRRLLWIVLAVVVLAAAAMIYVLTQRGGDDNAESSVAKQSETATSATGDTEEEQSAGDLADTTVKYPAPASAIDAPQIKLPSGNIACTLGDNGVICSIYSHGLHGPEVDTCVGQPVTLTTSGDPAKVGCLTIPISVDGATELAYGLYATSGAGVCHSTETGISCWDSVTGSSFAVAREGYVVGELGEIRPSDFPWQ